MRPLLTTLVSAALVSLAMTGAADPLPVPPNDEPTAAVQIPSYPTSIVGTNAGATVSSFDGWCMPPGAAASVWYYVDVPAGADWGSGFWVTTIGSTFDTFLGIYIDDDYDPGYGVLNLRGCNDDDELAGLPKGPTGKESRVWAEQNPYGGHRLLIQVGGVNGEVGQFQLNLDVEPVENAGEALCFEHNPAALTNVCLDAGEGTTNVPTPDPQAQDQPVCLVGPVCVGVPVPTVGWTETPVPAPAPDGYVEATAACALSVPCRVDV